MLDRGVPLTAPALRFFESRFREPLGAIRVHRGGSADAFCRFLGARAFAIGSDLVFRRGEFRLDTPSGARLVAHEIAHAIQQREASHREIVGIGDAESEMEREADLAADSVFRPGRVKPIGIDHERIIRRAPSVNVNNVTIDFQKKGAVPKTDILEVIPPAGSGLKQHKMAVSHLTMGVDPSKPFDPSMRLSTDCIAIVGEFDIALPPGEDISSWKFGFVQIADLKTRSARYLGSTIAEGSVDANYGIKPNYMYNPLHDVNDMRNIFVESKLPDEITNKGRGVNSVRHVKTTMFDYPTPTRELFAQNSRTNSQDLLYHLQNEISLVSVLTAQDNTQAFHFLAHIRWTITHDATFSWRNFQVPYDDRVTANQGTNNGFQVEKSVLGAPQGSGEQGILQFLQPNMMSANYHQQQAINNTISQRQAPNWVERKLWPTDGDVPDLALFYRY